jgi:hypothetical protein
VIENKQSREIADSATLMISMTYDQRRETFRFVSRKIRFVFAGLGLVDVRNARASARRRSSSLAPQIAGGLSAGWRSCEGQKKTLKLLKSFARVTCA